MIRLPIFILLWIGFLGIKIPTIILGVFVVPFMYRYRSRLYDHLPAWTRPWANPEDWTGGPKSFYNSMPKWWVDLEGGGFKAFWKYHAIRNPANGLRSFEWIDADIVASEVEWIGTRANDSDYPLEKYEPWYMRNKFPNVKTYWYLCWQGYQAGFKFVHHWSDSRHLVMKFGWRIEPNDAYKEIDPDGIRSKDSGFATKLLPYREG